MALIHQIRRAEDRKAAEAKVAKITTLIPAPEHQTKNRPGRKPSASSKKLISLRLDPDVIKGFKAAGDGWQSRINDALRKALGLPSGLSEE